MSGIAAIVNLDGSAISQSEIARVINVLKPYGADRQKALVLKNIALVFCLDAITPEDAFELQPVKLGDRFVMLFDGRLDNRSELLAELGLPSSEWPSIPDSVLVLKFFDRYGEKAFERLVGVFAIILMDLQEGSLICARDHIGLRVLHYHHTDDRFAVASVPEALFALEGVPRIMDEHKVADALVQRGLNGETTYYKQIYRVLPGFSVRLRGKNLFKHRYWDPEAIPDIRFKSDDDYVEGFNERLSVAVRAALRSRRLPCATITGGLDSSSIAVVAADMLAHEGQKLNTFTAVPEHTFARKETRSFYFDETPYVKQITDANPNLIPHFIPPSQHPVIDQIAKQIRVAGAPTGGVLNGLWTLDILAAARAHGHDVMLVGEMGNLTMSYDGWSLFPELLQKGRFLRLIRETAASGHRWKHMIRHRTIAPFIPKSIFKRYKQWRRGGLPPWHNFSAIHPELAARSGVIDRAAREFLPFDAPPARDGRLLRIHTFNSFCDTADWFTNLRAKLRVDLRTPAVDRRIVEFCLGIPNDQYLRNGCDRWLIRRAMKGRLPDAVLFNRKLGVQSADWFSRLTRERCSIGANLQRLSKNSTVRSTIELNKLMSILQEWPAEEPSRYEPQAYRLFWALPQALGAACFIQDVTGSNLQED